MAERSAAGGWLATYRAPSAPVQARRSRTSLPGRARASAVPQAALPRTGGAALARNSIALTAPRQGSVLAATSPQVRQQVPPPPPAGTALRPSRNLPALGAAAAAAAPSPPPPADVGAFRYCQMCLMDKMRCEGYNLPECGHWFCSECLEGWFTADMGQGKLMFTCPWDRDADVLVSASTISIAEASEVTTPDPASSSAPSPRPLPPPPPPPAPSSSASAAGVPSNARQAVSSSANIRLPPPPPLPPSLPQHPVDSSSLSSSVATSFNGGSVPSSLGEDAGLESAAAAAAATAIAVRSGPDESDEGSGSNDGAFKSYHHGDDGDTAAAAAAAGENCFVSVPLSIATGGGTLTDSARRFARWSGIALPEPILPANAADTSAPRYGHSDDAHESAFAGDGYAGNDAPSASRSVEAPETSALTAMGRLRAATAAAAVATRSSLRRATVAAILAGGSTPLPPPPAGDTSAASNAFVRPSLYHRASISIDGSTDAKASVPPRRPTLVVSDSESSGPSAATGLSCSTSEPETGSDAATSAATGVSASPDGASSPSSATSPDCGHLAVQVGSRQVAVRSFAYSSDGSSSQ